MRVTWERATFSHILLFNCFAEFRKHMFQLWSFVAPAGQGNHTCVHSKAKRSTVIVVETEMETFEKF